MLMMRTLGAILRIIHALLVEAMNNIINWIAWPTQAGKPVDLDKRIMIQGYGGACDGSTDVIKLHTTKSTTLFKFPRRRLGRKPA
jgi:hypothetical protein